MVFYILFSLIFLWNPENTFRLAPGDDGLAKILRAKVKVEMDKWIMIKIKEIK